MKENVIAITIEFLRSMNETLNKIYCLFSIIWQLFTNAGEGAATAEKLTCTLLHCALCVHRIERDWVTMYKSSLSLSHWVPAHALRPLASPIHICSGSFQRPSPLSKVYSFIFLHIVHSHWATPLIVRNEFDALWNRWLITNYMSIYNVLNLLKNILLRFNYLWVYSSK